MVSTYVAYTFQEKKKKRTDLAITGARPATFKVFSKVPCSELVFYWQFMIANVYIKMDPKLPLDYS